jgi:hypothetical protein
MSLPSLVAARNALWGWFRAGQLRIRREGDTDVLGVVDDYRLIRVSDCHGVRYAIETPGGKRYYPHEEDDPEEMASHLKWHYLLYAKPDDSDGVGEAEQESQGENSPCADGNQG